MPSPAIERLKQQGGRTRGGMLKAGGGTLQGIPAQRQENAGFLVSQFWGALAKPSRKRIAELTTRL